MLQSVSGTNRRWFLQTLVSHSLVPITVPNRATREFNASRTLDAHWLEALEHLSDVIMTHARRQRRARTMEQFTKTCAVVKEVRARNEKKRCEPAPVKLIPRQVKRCSFSLENERKTSYARASCAWRAGMAFFVGGRLGAGRRRAKVSFSAEHSRSNAVQRSSKCQRKYDNVKSLSGNPIQRQQWRACQRLLPCHQHTAATLDSQWRILIECKSTRFYSMNYGPLFAFLCSR